MSARLDVRTDGSERIRYNEPEFPVRAVESCLSVFYQYSAACHWHHDFEFLYVTDGALSYFVNGQIIHVSKGQVIFVNAERLHYGFSSARRECRYQCLLFHPSLLGDPTLPSRRYAAMLAADTQVDYLLLKPGDASDEPLIRLMESAFLRCREKAPYYQVEVQADCLRMVSALCQRISPDVSETAPDPAWQVLRQMLGYLQENYQRKIVLADIAAAGAVCRSKCCHIFSTYLNKTPIHFLCDYRLEKSRAQLSGSRASITEVAQSCGFEGASYFSEQFRAKYGISPREYRLKNKIMDCADVVKRDEQESSVIAESTRSRNGT